MEFNSRGKGGVIFINKSNSFGIVLKIRFVVIYLSSKG